MRVSKFPRETDTFQRLHHVYKIDRCEEEFKKPRDLKNELPEHVTSSNYLSSLEMLLTA